jgi:hypothetical protein
MRGVITASLAVLAALFFGGCTSTGATFRSGVGDRLIEHPPYYAGASQEAVARDTGRIGHLPVAFQRGASQPAVFDPRDGSGSPVDALLEAMNAYLDSLGVSARLVEGRRTSAVAHRATAEPPDIRFGCAPDLGLPGNDCAPRGDSALGRGYQTMLLAVGRPSAEWITWMRGVTEATHAERTLVITLEIGQYLTRQEGLRGTKVVELGSGNTTTFPWLTSLETPVSVLQLTGALVDRDGKAVRIGAEGFYARRTRLLPSSIGAQELLTDDDLRTVLAFRREDLPGRPLAWRVALRELATRLTGRGAAL